MDRSTSTDVGCRANQTVTHSNASLSILFKICPFLAWFHHYSLDVMWKDFIAGLNVGLVLVPQSMAYAQLAGLPVYYGLYAAFLPPMVAAMFGSSHQLATGPVAIVSLMTATALEPLAIQGSESYIAYAILLALIVGLFQFLLGILRLGVLVNFLSHPVVIGFTNAAAIIIASSQLAKFFGVNVESAHYHYETVCRIISAAVHYTHWPTLGMALLSIFIMVGLRKVFPKIPNVLAAVFLTTAISWALGFERNETVRITQIQAPNVIEKIGEFNRSFEDFKQKSKERAELAPVIRQEEEEYGLRSARVIHRHHEASLLKIDITQADENCQMYRTQLRRTFFVRTTNDAGKSIFYQKDNAPSGIATDNKIWRLKVKNQSIGDTAVLTSGGAVVGSIPKGLPKLKVPKLDFSIVLQLLPIAVIISLLGFMEAISIAKAMAVKTGQRLDPNQELIGQGLSNVFGAFGQSYPVSGSFSRSAVNIQSGALTGMSSVFTSCFVILVLLFLTPLLYHLPQAVLASIIMMAVIRLVDIPGMARAWRTQKYDGVIAGVSFLFTLGFAPHLETGIMIGVFLSLAVFFYNHMRPRVALLSKHPDGSYRDADRWGMEKCRAIAVIRFNGSLFFADASYLENKILERVSGMPDLKHILIVGNAINEMDASGEDMLSSIIDRLHEAGYEVSFSGLNDSILDIMRRTHLYEKVGEDHMFRNVKLALQEIHEKAHADTLDEICPLLHVCPSQKPQNQSKNNSSLLSRLVNNR